MQGVSLDPPRSGNGVKAAASRSDTLVTIKLFESRTGAAEQDQPVVQVSHETCALFAAWLPQRATGRTYELPTEVEWDRARQAGMTPFALKSLVGQVIQVLGPRNHADTADRGVGA